jgi:signal transduction histidine kinase
MSVQTVPVRALALSLIAMAGAITAAVFWPQDLLDRGLLAGGLALLPALLLAHYRGWSTVIGLLGLGVIVLCIADLVPQASAVLHGSFVVPFVVAPYIAIALGAGWFGEARRYQAEIHSTQLQLIQSEKLDSIGRMAAGVAHEVKNPLMMILTGVKILSKRLGPDADEQTRMLLQDMTDAVGRADTIIGGLLSYSRDRALDLAPVGLNATIEKSLLLVKHDLDKGRIAVVKDFDPSLPLVKLDEFKIEQVFVNLITNAIHAMEHDGEITLRTSLHTLKRGKSVGYRKTDRYAPGERVAMVQIEDRGPGIPEKHLEKLFDPFFTTKPTGSGTGLGLSVSRQIVEMHGGTIEIANRREGGARATLIFKLEEMESHA